MKTPHKGDEPTEFWDVLESRLTMSAAPAEPISQSVIEALLRKYPRRKGEELEAWIHRICTPATGQAVPRRRDHRAQRIRWLTECERLAADTSGAATLPHAPLKSLDGEFQLDITPAKDGIALTVRALGFAAVDLAGRQIVVSQSREAAQPFAAVTLDEDGEGRCVIVDDAHSRSCLVHPVIGLLEADDAAEMK